MDVCVESAVFTPAVEILQEGVAPSEEVEEKECGAEAPPTGDNPASRPKTPQAEAAAEKNLWSAWAWLGLCKSPSRKIPNIVHVDVDAFFASVEQEIGRASCRERV